MDSITLTFPKPLNVSVQVGDTAYYTNDVNGKDIELIGLITSVSSKAITAQISPSQIRPTTSSFILKGYYAEMQFKNDSTTYAELFSVGSEIFISSK